MMAAAKATHYQDWEANMEEIKKVNQEAVEWLLAIPRKCWRKHAFNAYSRCDVLMNNLSESFNSTILLARDKPIITMMEWIRTYLISRFAHLREKLTAYTGVVMPKPNKRLDREVEKSGNWFAIWTGDGMFEVIQGFKMEKFIVDFTNHTYSFYFWNLVGIPCRHVVVDINYRVEQPFDYVHAYYKIGAYQACYGSQISPINGQQLWPKTNAPQILPLIYKTPLGRSRKLRRREPDEDVSHSILGKKNLRMKCSNYGQLITTSVQAQDKMKKIA